MNANELREYSKEMLEHKQKENLMKAIQHFERIWNEYSEDLFEALRESVKDYPELNMKRLDLDTEMRWFVKDNETHRNCILNKLSDLGYKASFTEIHGEIEDLVISWEEDFL